MSTPPAPAPMPDAARHAWPDLERRLHAAGDAVRALPVDREQGRAVAARLPADVAPLAGALALRTGGLLVDHGWFRLLGGGSAGLPDLAAANGLDSSTGAPVGREVPPGPRAPFLIGFDALGGRFAVDRGTLGVGPGEVCYFGPDTLRWDGLGGGYRAFLHALLDGALAEVFAGLRWDGWADDVAALTPAEALDATPPLFTRAAHEPGADVVRRPVPVELLVARFDAIGADLDAPDPDDADPDDGPGTPVGRAGA